MARLVPYMGAFVAALVTVVFLFHHLKTPTPTIEDRGDSVIDGPCTFDPVISPTEEERFRVSFGTGPGVSVRGWPSKGGIYILEHCFAIELDFLKLDKFKDTPRPSPSGPGAAAEEEAHCNRMRQLGAIWWKSDTEWFMEHLTKPNNPWREERYIQVGWPAGGGVWVLNITEDDATKRGTGIIYNARDMEERCRLIEQLGGVFYENPKDWLDVELPSDSSPLDGATELSTHVDDL